VDGRYYATSNICTHATAFLTEGWLEGTLIECPLHAGQFDIRDGKGQGAPISCDLQTFPVRTEGGDVEIFVE
jgi:nitrite reductase/ring-hydroxylating ferredoxin subunit